MSTLDSLVRLHRWQVDERQRQVAALESLALKLREELARLAEEQAADETAAASFLARHVYPGTVRRALERKKTLEQSLAAADVQTLAARDALAQTAQELKRYEVACTTRERLRIHAAARRDTGTVAFEPLRRASGA